MMNQSTIIVTVLLSVLLFIVPKKWFLLPFVMMICIIPADQRVMIMGLDFTPLRVLVLCGVLRLHMASEVRSIRWNSFDKLIFAWMASGSIIYIIQWHTFSAVIYKSGVLLDCIGLYWIFRQILTSWNDVFLVIKLLAFFAIIHAPFMIYERVAHNNIFSMFGQAAVQFHRGRWRCSGPFPHPIIMGLFWANLVPFFMAGVMANRSRALYVIAVICCLVCVVVSGSSTPLITVLLVFCIFALYKYRRYGRQMAWGFCSLLLALHIVMQAPVWHLISRVNVFGGSTGWHRYHLIDMAIAHSKEWAILGCRSAAHWGYGLQDVTNQYILEGVRGGLTTLIVFGLLLVYAVKTPCSYSLRCAVNDERWLSWGICISVLGHCISFLGVSYFGQITVLLYLTFAMVGLIAERSRASAISHDLN